MFTVVSIIDDALGEIHPVLVFAGNVAPVATAGFGPDMEGSFQTQVDVVEAPTARTALSYVKQAFNEA